MTRRLEHVVPFPHISLTNPSPLSVGHVRPQVFTVEMHHKRVDKAGPGDNVGMNIKGLDKVRNDELRAHEVDRGG